MNEQNIVLFARVKVKPGMVEKAKSAALAIVADSRAEGGCVNYDLHQSIEDETLFLWHETWTGKEAIDEHFATPFFRQFAKAIEECATEPPEINLTRMVSYAA